MKLISMLILGLLIASSQLTFAGEIPCENAIDAVLIRIGYAKLSAPTEYRFAQKNAGSSFNHGGLTEALASKEQIASAIEHSRMYCENMVLLENMRWSELNTIRSYNKLPELEAKVKKELADTEQRYDSQIASYRQQCARSRQEEKKLSTVDIVACRTPDCVDAALRGENPTTKNIIDNPVVTITVQKNEVDLYSNDIKIHTSAGDYRINPSTCTIRPFTCTDFVAAGLPTFGQCGFLDVFTDAAKFLSGRAKKEVDQGLR